MKFRDEQVDDVKIAESTSKEGLIEYIKAVGKKNIIVDLQYADSRARYSALILTRKKRRTRKYIIARG